jgi:hypothetical protein
MAAQCARLGMAIMIIALISICLYAFSSHAGVFEPNVSATSQQR